MKLSGISVFGVAGAAMCLGTACCIGDEGDAKTMANADDIMRVFVGTYTRGASKGIYVCRFNPVTATLELTGETAMTRNPTFLALHPSGHYLYAVNETSETDGKPVGAVSAYAIDPGSGALTFINHRSSHGKGPCHVAVDATGRVALVANYGSGSVASLAIDAQGALAEAASAIQHEGSSVDPKRQRGPHAHSMTVDPSNRLAFAADLGLDRLLAYTLEPAVATLTRRPECDVKTAGGAGPRHFTFHPNGRFAFLINELDSTMTALKYEREAGTLVPIETLSTLPEGFREWNACADVHVSPDGRFVYGSNRGHNSIVVYRVEADTGRLTRVGFQSTGGKIPRNFAVDPSGRFLLAANQDTDNVVVFRLNAATGMPEPTGHEIAIPAPVCVVFAPSQG